jgi:hypothetical protein
MIINCSIVKKFRIISIFNFILGLLSNDQPIKIVIHTHTRTKIYWWMVKRNHWNTLNSFPNIIPTTKNIKSHNLISLGWIIITKMSWTQNLAYGLWYKSPLSTIFYYASVSLQDLNVVNRNKNFMCQSSLFLFSLFFW